MEFLIKGIMIGFIVAAPVGPVGLLTIRRSLSHGQLLGFVTGLGAAAADGIFGAVAAFGLTAVTSFLTAHQEPLRLIGGIAMIILGVHAARTPLSMPSDEQKTEFLDLGGAFLSTLGITLTNPITIMGFAAAYSTLAAHPHNLLSATELTAGVFLGSAAWWVILSWFSVWWGTRMKPASLRWVNVAAGLSIAIVGFWQLAHAALSRIS